MQKFFQHSCPFVIEHVQNTLLHESEEISATTQTSILFNEDDFYEATKTSEDYDIAICNNPQENIETQMSQALQISVDSSHEDENNIEIPILIPLEEIPVKIDGFSENSWKLIGKLRLCYKA